jgi:excisionase family DNA binding protein
MYTTKQIADKLGLHPKTVARFARTNVIPAYFAGGRHGWIFRLADVKRALGKKRGNRPFKAIESGKVSGYPNFRLGANFHAESLGGLK